MKSRYNEGGTDRASREAFERPHIDVRAIDPQFLWQVGIDNRIERPGYKNSAFI